MWTIYELVFEPIILPILVERNTWIPSIITVVDNEETKGGYVPQLASN